MFPECRIRRSPADPRTGAMLSLDVVLHNALQRVPTLHEKFRLTERMSHVSHEQVVAALERIHAFPEAMKAEHVVSEVMSIASPARR